MGFLSGYILLGAINFALCIRGTCGKDTLRRYPSFRVPTATRISMILSELLDLLSPLKKMRKTCHHHQIDRQNKQKAKVAYAQALAQATTLIATERGKKKEKAPLTQSIITRLRGSSVCAASRCCCQKQLSTATFGMT
jgi:hypothetical protein